MRRAVWWGPGLLVLGLSLGACQGGPAGPPAEEPPPVQLLVDAEGPWREVPIEAGDVASSEPAMPSVPEPSRPKPLAVTSGPRSVPATLAVPRRRVTPEPAALGTRPDRSPRDLARERHLSHPTHIKAERITFYCPPFYIREVRLTGADVRDTRPGRRMATGNARLTCRELLLEAHRIVLRTLEDPQGDLQITARGNVEFVTDQRGQVLRQTGCRSLILTNEEVVPLR